MKDLIDPKDIVGKEYWIITDISKNILCLDFQDNEFYYSSSGYRQLFDTLKEAEETIISVNNKRRISNPHRFEIPSKARIFKVKIGTDKLIILYEEIRWKIKSQTN